MEKICGNNDGDEVKSTAVVKYSVPKPAKFVKLKCNTDLNLPPSNWLSNSADSYGLQHVLYQHKEFSSFRMAHMFPDCVGEVDVVSDAENIKNLLKIPYNKGHISMMVHRVENTLLLDDFDIYKHLLRTAETEWEWLRKFFCENVESDTLDEERMLYIKTKRRKALQQKHLISKFLYYSLIQSEGDDDVEGCEVKHSPLPVEGPLLPEPSRKEEVPDPASFEHKYNRNVVWTFEDIEMLIGTDMPIFGGGTHPCISLRLRDMNKPINVLTGIDYWLDNLMSNVPEVVMCYHLNGIVQKYELIKTEDLPNIKDSKFSPKLIRDVAQSILSFLKSNATKAGHTYWLFKGKDEEVVKLYDLTSLCAGDDVNEDSDQNPFTVPVAMLLYRVARNMKHSRDNRQPGTIRMLLKNCVKLLQEEKYPEIVTSSHYMLSDLYVPAETNPDNPKLDQEVNEDCVFEDDEDLDPSAAMKFLILDSNRNDEKFDDHYKPPPPISGTIEERCLQSINHVALGINCLQYFLDEREKREKRREEDNIPMAKPSEPIPMPYRKLSDKGVSNSCINSRKKEKMKKKCVSVEITDALLPKNKGEAQALPAWERADGAISWREHLKTLLYEKSVLVYAILSEHHYVSKNYGSSLRCLGLLVRCLEIMSKLHHSSNTLKENCLLGRAGDCCVMMVQTWDNGENYRNQFHTFTDEDARMLEQIEKDERLYDIHLADSGMRCVLLHDIRTIEQILLKAVECYQHALRLADSDSILRRLANSLNELGSFYLNRAKNSTSCDNILDFCKKSEPYLKNSAEIFEKVKDEANVALVYTNMGHLHRLLAYAHTPGDRGELTAKEKVHYNKAFVNYVKALQVIGERKHCPGIWDAVNWELSTALFTMATVMHENPSSELSIQEAEKEVIETLQKALKYCDLDENNPKFPLYQYRAATIYYRLGSLYHKNVWLSGTNETNRRSKIQLSKLNYEKAAKMFSISMDPVNCLTSQMQRFALTEYLSETANVPHTKLKHLQNCLELILELQEMLASIAQRKVDVNDADVGKFNVKTKDPDDFKSCSSLAILVKQRLQHVLRSLIKICMAKPPVTKDCAKLTVLYKECYTVTFALEKECEFYGFVQKLSDVLLDIREREVKGCT